MKTLFGFGTVMALAMAAVACGNSPEESTPSSSLEVTGTVDTRLRSLDNASAVAIGSDGRTFSAYLQRNGSFTLDLPVGHVYRIIIANSTTAGELRTIGHLVNSTSDGRSDEIAVRQGGKMNLGALRPAGASANSLKTACNCDESGGDKSGKGEAEPDHEKGGGEGDYEKGGDKGDYEKGGGKGGEKDVDDDFKSKPKDGDKDRICEDDSDVELEPEIKPGDKCKKQGSDKPAPKPTKKSCSTKDADKDGKDDADTKKTEPADGKVEGKDDGSGKEADKGDYGDKGGDTGGKTGDSSKPTGGSCTCSLDCGKGASCFASKCAADDAPTKK